MILAWISRYFANRYFQYLICGLIAGVCWAVFFSYTERLSASTEKELINHTLSILRRGVQVYIFEQMITGRKVDYEKYHHSNPMNMLMPPPNNYIGEWKGEEVKNRKPGFWYFELETNQLVYRPFYRDALEYPEKEELRVMVVFNPEQNDLRSISLIKI